MAVTAGSRMGLRPSTIAPHSSQRLACSVVCVPAGGVRRVVGWNDIDLFPPMRLTPSMSAVYLSYMCCKCVSKAILVSVGKGSAPHADGFWGSAGATGLGRRPGNSRQFDKKLVGLVREGCDLVALRGVASAG